MGKRGPKPTPTTILVNRGSWRANARVGEPETSGSAVRPAWVKGPARRKWDELVALLERMGIIGDIDSGALARYCDTWAWWLKFRKQIAEDGETVKSTNKEGKEYVTQNPDVNTVIKLAGILARLEGEFGLSPASRTNIKRTFKDVPVIPEQPTGDGKKRFFANSA